MSEIVKVKCKGCQWISWMHPENPCRKCGAHDWLLVSDGSSLSLPVPHYDCPLPPLGSPHTAQTPPPLPPGRGRGHRGVRGAENGMMQNACVTRKIWRKVQMFGATHQNLAKFVCARGGKGAVWLT